MDLSQTSVRFHVEPKFQVFTLDKMSDYSNITFTYEDLIPLGQQLTGNHLAVPLTAGICLSGISNVAERIENRRHLTYNSKQTCYWFLQYNINTLYLKYIHYS